MTAADRSPSGNPARWLRIALVTAAACAAVSWFALQLSLAAGYASPMYPSAGIALAATLVFGAPGAIGAAVGGFAIHALQAASTGHTAAQALFLLPATLGLGAALQAALGAWLVRKHVGPSLALRMPGEILRFGLWGGVVACLFNATLGTSALGLTGAVAVSDLPVTWSVWWMGDLLGVLIGAPIALTLIGRPRADWTARRLSVGLPMLLGTLLLALVATQFYRFEHERLRETFERSASSATAAAQQQLEEAIQALHALHGALAGRDSGDASQLQPNALWWLEQANGLRALGYSERVERARIPAFEAQAQAEGLAGYRVFDREWSTAPAAADDYVVAIRAIEPMARNARALGVNAMSIPPAREALLAAARNGADVATRGFRLTQAGPEENLGVVVYRALYRGRPIGEAERLAQWRGAVFATLSPDESLRVAMQRVSSSLQWCLVDNAAAPGLRRLAGDTDCDLRRDADFRLTHVLAMAGQAWELRLTANARDLPGGRHTASWLFSIVGLAATSMLGLLLLTVTGRARRIELAVDERTRALSAEVRERRGVEEALRRSEQRLRSILDHVPIGVLFMDLQGNVLEANPSICRMVGRSAEEISRLSLGELAHPDARSLVMAQIWEAAAGHRQAGDCQMRLMRRDGTDLTVRATLAILPEAPDQPRRLVGVVEDITEHLRLAETERARDAAEASNRAKSEFVSRMSHELRTPLNAILGFAQLLGMDRSPALPPNQAGWTSQIQHAGWHLLELINETLDLSRIESGLVHLHPRDVELVAMVDASVALVATAAEKQDLHFQIDLSPNTLAVAADETRLKQVLTNLLSNAVKYNRAGGAIRIDARAADPDTVELRVHDTGLGMTPDQLRRLFQPYDRLGREASGIEGTGIGLVISRRLAELMGGSLDASSVPGEGSVFTLRLPHARQQGAAAVIDHDREESALRYRRRLVHYIEDNETNAEIMRGILAQRPQVTLEVSASGTRGLAVMRQRRPDLILLDLNLPDVSGFELLRTFKRDDDLAEVPVIVVSADATPAHVEEALTLGAVHYVTKPVDISLFMQALDETLADMDTRWG